MPVDPYARLLNIMLPYHNRFRQTYATIQATLHSPHPQSLPQRRLETLLHQTLNLTHHLDAHHHIEESFIFPVLAVRMPQFGAGDAGDKGHVEEHRRMHASLETLRTYARSVERLLSGSAGRKAVNDGAGQVLPSSQQDSDDDEVEKRKDWPTAIFDSARFKALVGQLGATLFPHLEAEETSLRPANIKAAGDKRSR
ncbi:unnamed protein product [Tilletia caries]|nr:unnamed protein product [Tilletia caries]